MNVDPAVERLAIDLAARVRDAVAPSLGEPGARDGVGVAPGGDVTMAIDEIAEHVVEQMCRDAGDIAFYSEDRGYVEFGTPRAILVVDPIDGTRPAAAGLESCCVSVAVVPPVADATLGDVELGIVHEIKSGTAVHRAPGRRSARPTYRVRLFGEHRSRRAVLDRGVARAGPRCPITIALEELIDGSIDARRLLRSRVRARST